MVQPITPGGNCPNTGQRHLHSLAPEACLLVVLAVNLSVVWLLSHFPYSDVTNHLARYTLISEELFNGGVRWASFEWIPTPYVGVDLVGAVLVRLLSPQTTLRIMASLGVCLLPVGLYALQRSVWAPSRGWAVVAGIAVRQPVEA